MYKFGSKRHTSSNHSVLDELAKTRLIFLSCITFLLGLGAVMGFSAISIEIISQEGSLLVELLSQVVIFSLSIGAMFLCWRVFTYKVFAGRLMWVFYIGALVLVSLTFLYGFAGGGAVRWIRIGPLSLQPSELYKIISTVVAAVYVMKFLDARQGERGGIALQGVAALFAPLAFIVVAQSDLGTVIICAVGILSVMWFAGVDMKIIGLILLAGVVLAAFLIVFEGYRMARFTSHLDPWSDPYVTGYQLIRALYAFAQGGLFGVGLGNSAEKFLYLPDAETDFIIAIIGEELGTVMVIAVIVAFCLYLWAALKMARLASDKLGMVIVSALAIMLVFQAFLNIGCATGLLPITGKPLPFLSQGGSSLLSSCVITGIILSATNEVSMKEKYAKSREKISVVRGGRSRNNSAGSNYYR